jgi:hypothetical protein
MKIASIVSIVTILGWSILSLFQLWGAGIDWGIYIKVTVTVVLLNVAIGIASIIFKEYLSDKNLKKDKFLG